MYASSEALWRISKTKGALSSDVDLSLSGSEFQISISATEKNLYICFSPGSEKKIRIWKRRWIKVGTNVKL